MALMLADLRVASKSFVWTGMDRYSDRSTTLFKKFEAFYTRNIEMRVLHTAFIYQPGLKKNDLAKPVRIEELNIYQPGKN